MKNKLLPLFWVIGGIFFGGFDLLVGYAALHNGENFTAAFCVTFALASFTIAWIEGKKLLSIRIRSIEARPGSILVMDGDGSLRPITEGELKAMGVPVKQGGHEHLILAVMEMESIVDIVRSTHELMRDAVLPELISLNSVQADDMAHTVEVAEVGLEKMEQSLAEWKAII